MIALLVLGVALVVATSVDVFLTVIHPTRRGPLSFLVGRGTFTALSRLARRLDRPTLLGPAGPLAMLAMFAMWVLLIWVGYALIYLPDVDGLAYRTSVDYGDPDMLEALYFSGMSLTTVGFGDVVANADGYRIVSIVEAATGFAVMTGAITFVLSVYPRVTNERVAARSVQSQATDLGQAAAMVRSESYLVALHSQLLELDEYTDRFPILFFFHSEDDYASKHTFFRGTMTVCLAARWAIDSGRVEHARRWGDELEQSLHRTIDHYATRFMHGHGPEDLDRQLDRDDARRRLARLVEAAGADGDLAVVDDPDAVTAFARFTGRCDQFLEHLAEQHQRPDGALAA